MGLSVISTIAPSVNTTAVNLTSEATATEPGRFAALLAGQTLAGLLGAAAGLPGEAGKAGLDTEEKASSEAQGTAQTSSPVDPATLVALLGNAQVQPPLSPRPTAGQEAASAHDALQADAAGLASLPPGHDRPGNHLRDTTLAASPSTPGERPGTVQSGATDVTRQADAANIAASGEPANPTPTFQMTLGAAQPTREAPASQPSSIATPLHAPAWPQHFGEKLVWMARNDQQTAQINLNPPQLGPLQVTLHLNGDQATAVFASPHAEVRQAIESSLPQLRDMLSATGITLGDTNVGANLAQQNQNPAFPLPNRAQSPLENAILPANDNAPVAGTATPLHHGRGLVDLFA
ncbi:MAG: flagellar hook-length control protein FliK [Azonexus sp.]